MNAHAQSTIASFKRLADRHPVRRATASVELAVCLPVMVMMVLGTIETCNSIFIKQVATMAASEAGKIATSMGGTTDHAEKHFHEIMATSQLNGASLTFSPANPATVARGSNVLTTVSIPASSNNLGGVNLLFQGKTFSAQITMVKQ